MKMTDGLIEPRNDEERLIEAQESLVFEVQELICELLEEHELSQRDLAERLGVSASAMSQWLRDDANPSLKTVAKILFGLGATLKVSVAPDAQEALPEKKTFAGVREAIEEAFRERQPPSGAPRAERFAAGKPSPPTWGDIESPAPPSGDCADEQAA